MMKSAGRWFPTMFTRMPRYEDLRPVSREYIHRCHLRVKQHLPLAGTYLLDAGSGPIQYPEYLEYSRDHKYRVCADISITALLDARKRIGDHGLFVVCDVTRLPFKKGVFEGAVTLHTFHHLPLEKQPQAYDEIYRVLAEDSSAVVVNGWGHSPLMEISKPFIFLGFRLQGLINRLLGRSRNNQTQTQDDARKPKENRQKKPKGTFSRHSTPEWLKSNITNIPLDIRVWRSVSVLFLRGLIHPRLGGRYWLRFLFSLENQFPRFFGENGQYPLIILHKGSLSHHKDSLTGMDWNNSGLGIKDN